MLPAGAQTIEEGPYRFSSDSYFVATATYTPYTFFTVADIEERTIRWGAPAGANLVRWTASMVEGYSPNSFIDNLGGCIRMACVGQRCGGGELDPELEILTLGFDPGFEPEEGPGIDFVVFDTNRYAFSIPNDYFVRVRPSGGGWSSIHQFLAAGSRHFIRTLPSDLGELTAIEMDFEVFGLPHGTVYEEVEIFAGCPLMTNPEPDIVMAAAIERACAASTDCVGADPCLSATCTAGRCRYAPAPPGTPCSTGVCDGLGQPACVECVDDSTCGGERPACDLARFECVGCVDDADCPTGRCEPTRQTCVECLEPADCPSDPTRPCREPACSMDWTCGVGGPVPDGLPCFGNGYCHGETAECVGCRSDSHCTSDAQSRCDIPRGDCVACLEDRDCPPPEDPCRVAACGLDTRCTSRRVPGCEADAGVPDLGPPDAGVPDAESGLRDGGRADELPGDEGCGCRQAHAHHGSGRFSAVLLGFLIFALYRRASILACAARR